jgi:hypothetical protein
VNHAAERVREVITHIAAAGACNIMLGSGGSKTVPAGTGFQPYRLAYQILSLFKVVKIVIEVSTLSLPVSRFTELVT